MIPRTDKQRISMARKILRASKADPELATHFQENLDAITNLFAQFKNRITEREQLERNMAVARQKRDRALRRVQNLLRRGWAEVRYNVNQETFKGQIRHFHFTDSGFIPEGEKPDRWVEQAEKLLEGMVANDANGYKPLDIEPSELETQKNVLDDQIMTLDTLGGNATTVTVQLDKLRSNLSEAFRLFEALLLVYFHAQPPKVRRSELRKFGFTVKLGGNNSQGSTVPEPDTGSDGEPPGGDEPSNPTEDPDPPAPSGDEAPKPDPNPETG